MEFERCSLYDEDEIWESVDLETLQKEVPVELIEQMIFWLAKPHVRSYKYRRKFPAKITDWAEVFREKSRKENE